MDLHPACLFAKEFRRPNFAAGRSRKNETAINVNSTMSHRHLLLPLLLVALQIRLASAEEAECATTSVPYSGVDVSYPIHSQHTISDNPLGDKATWYDSLINGCRESCDRCKAACDQTEKDRILMNRRQPQSMVNYTDFGIKKIRVSRLVEQVVDPIIAFGFSLASGPGARATPVSFTHHLLIDLEMNANCVERSHDAKDLIA